MPSLTLVALTGLVQLRWFHLFRLGSYVSVAAPALCCGVLSVFFCFVVFCLRRAPLHADCAAFFLQLHAVLTLCECAAVLLILQLVALCAVLVVAVSAAWSAFLFALSVCSAHRNPDRARLGRVMNRNRNRNHRVHLVHEGSKTKVVCRHVFSGAQVAHDYFCAHAYILPSVRVLFFWMIDMNSNSMQFTQHADQQHPFKSHQHPATSCSLTPESIWYGECGP